MEHGLMKENILRLEKAVARQDFQAAAATLDELERIFKQHIADEEAQVLRILIEAYGVKGADDAIKVFRQHRPIYELVSKVKALSSLPPDELASNQDKLKALLDEHTRAEEQRVFPEAQSAYRKRSEREADAAESSSTRAE
jgi:iron-sulfur cluster repair protein YtfE (RIC family)